MSSVNWKDLGASVRGIYQKWDSGQANTERTLASLSALSIPLTEEFVDLLQHYSRSRNLPFTSFMKALQTTPSPEPVASFPVTPLTFKEIADFNRKCYPESAPMKAPYGTSEMSEDLDHHFETASVATSVRGGALKASAKKQLTPSAFIPSFPAEDEAASNWGSEQRVPAHMVGNVSVVGDVSESITSGFNGGPREGPRGGHGDVITWDPSRGASTPEEVQKIKHETHKRHFDYVHLKSDNDMLRWEKQEQVPKKFPDRQNIIAHLEESSRPSSSDSVPIVYPFATESDDLDKARRLIHKQRVHKYTAH